MALGKLKFTDVEEGDRVLIPAQDTGYFDGGFHGTITEDDCVVLELEAVIPEGGGSFTTFGTIVDKRGHESEPNECYEIHSDDVFRKTAMSLDEACRILHEANYEITRN